MGVLAFNRPRESRAPLTTLFMVDTYWKDRALRLSRAEPVRYWSAVAAIRAARGAARRAAAVRVYSVRGNPEVDYWEEPIVLATYGSPPA